jgi:hypothetical protein
MRGAHWTGIPEGENDMAARKAKAVAKAQAMNREQEIQRIWKFTVASALTLVAVTVVLLAL